MNRYQWVLGVFVMVSSMAGMENKKLVKAITVHQLQKSLDVLHEHELLDNVKFGKLYARAREICKSLNKNKIFQSFLAEDTISDLSLAKWIEADTSDVFDAIKSKCLRDASDDELEDDSEDEWEDGITRSSNKKEKTLTRSYDEELTGRSPDGLFGDFDPVFISENKSL